MAGDDAAPKRRLQIFGRLDDFRDEVLANADQTRVLGEVARVDRRALRLDQVTLDRVAGEVIDLDLARRLPALVATGRRAAALPPSGRLGSRSSDEHQHDQSRKDLPHLSPS